MPQRAPRIPQNFEPAAPSPWELLTTPSIEFAPSPEPFQSVTGFLADTTSNLADMDDSYGVGFASKYLIDPIAQSLNKAAMGEPISPLEVVDMALPVAGGMARPVKQLVDLLISGIEKPKPDKQSLISLLISKLTSKQPG